MTQPNDMYMETLREVKRETDVALFNHGRCLYARTPNRYCCCPFCHGRDHGKLSTKPARQQNENLTGLVRDELCRR